jgi:membrane associated rhomboid family serine protease
VLVNNGGGLLAGLFGLVALPSWLVVGLYFSLQLFSGLLVLVNPAYAGAVGYWAHVGGFVSGAVLAWVFPRRGVQPAGRLLPG